MNKPVLNVEDLVVDYDPRYRIVHLTARRPVHARTLEDGYCLLEAVSKLLAGCLGTERGFMVTDLSRVIIEPKEIEKYSEGIKKLIDTYLYPGGIARYGFDIGRVTVQLSQAYFSSDTANLFKTKAEAVDFLRKLSAKFLTIPESDEALKESTASDTAVHAFRKLMQAGTKS